MKLNKFETIGVAASVAVMALALWLIRLDTTNQVVADLGANQAAVYVAEGENQQALLADAFVEASDGTGINRLVIDDVVFGEGDAVETGDTVLVHYTGTLQNGVQFDSSVTRGEPFEFTVGAGRVIAGWEEGLLGMQVGGKRILVVPARLGYGDRKVGPIPSNSTLVFTIELLEIK